MAKCYCVFQNARRLFGNCAGIEYLQEITERRRKNRYTVQIFIKVVLLWPSLYPALPRGLLSADRRTNVWHTLQK